MCACMQHPPKIDAGNVRVHRITCQNRTKQSSVSMFAFFFNREFKVAVTGQALVCMLVVCRSEKLHCLHVYCPEKRLFPNPILKSTSACDINTLVIIFYNALSISLHKTLPIG